MTSADQTAQMIDTSLRAMAHKLAEARRVMGSGDLVDLTELAHDTRALCDAVHRLPENEANSLRGDLEAMLYDLDSLATELTERFGQQARRGSGRPQQRTLAAAYRAGAPAPERSTDQET